MRVGALLMLCRIATVTSLFTMIFGPSLAMAEALSPNGENGYAPLSISKDLAVYIKVDQVDGDVSRSRLLTVEYGPSLASYEDPASGPSKIEYSVEFDCNLRLVKFGVTAVDLRTSAGRNPVYVAPWRVTRQFATPQTYTEAALDYACTTAKERGNLSQSDALADADKNVQLLSPPPLIIDPRWEDLRYPVEVMVSEIYGNDDLRVLIDWKSALENDNTISARTIWLVAPGDNLKTRSVAFRDIDIDCTNHKIRLLKDQIWSPGGGFEKRPLSEERDAHDGVKIWGPIAKTACGREVPDNTMHDMKSAIEAVQLKLNVSPTR